MSNWITDRRPTEEDCKGVLGTLYESQVWVNVLDTVETFDFFHVEAGVAWHPIVIEKPEPYVAPEPKYHVKFWLAEKIGEQNRWCVYCDVGGIHVIQADNLPTLEAAERIAAIYNEVIP